MVDRRSVTVLWMQVGMHCAHSRSGKRQCLLVRFRGSCHQHEVHQPPGEAVPCAQDGAHTGTVGNMCFQFSREEFMVPIQEVQSLDPEDTSQKCTFKDTLIITIVNSCIFVLHI